MASNRSANVGAFPRLLERDYLDGRLRPEVLAAELGVDPSWVSRLISGDLPLPASLVGALVRHTQPGPSGHLGGAWCRGGHATRLRAAVVPQAVVIVPRRMQWN